MSVYDELTETQQFASRVIADHARSTAFAIADGILPGNEGRNYVLRKIMRRAIYHGREHLALNELFFYKVCDEVVTRFQGAFPELATQRDFIGKMVRIEEERFSNTLTAGLGKFSDIDKFIDEVRDDEWLFNDSHSLTITVDLPSSPTPKKSLIFSNGKLVHVKLIYPDGREVLESPDSIPNQERIRLEQQYTDIKNILDAQKSGTLPNYNDIQKILREKQQIDEHLKSIQAIRPLLDDLHKKNLFRKMGTLYDTYGVPRDLMRLKLKERGFEFGESEFTENLEASVQELQEKGEVGHTTRKSQPSPVYAKLLEKVSANQFDGYYNTRLSDCKVLAILNGEQEIDYLPMGATGGVILDKTPFYAEAGGQVGDQGILTGIDKSARVSDTFSPITGLTIHKVLVRVGELKVGDLVSADVDVASRDATRRNHTATHLVHAALREVLGTHVKQAGSVVGPSVLRFDFTHYQPVTAAEIAEVEDLVNRHILENNPVNTNVMSIEEAMHGGAMALFGEKYGADVRVLSVGDGIFSKELCGGTHVRATGDIGSFKITGDEAIASGVRRIRAITGFDAFNRFREDERLIDASLGALNTQRDNLPNAITRLQDELKRTRKEMDELKLKIACGSIGDASSGGDEPREINGVKVLAKIVEGLDAGGTRQLSDTLLARLKSGVVIIGRSEEGKVGIIVRVSDDITSKVKAGDIIREIAPIVGGRGGGKPDMAEGGGTDPSKLVDAIEASYGVIERILT